MREQVKSFFNSNLILILAVIICAFIAFYNLGNIEFWGEDEAQTLHNAARFIMGLENHSKANLTALYGNATLSLVILIQVPFILIFGVCELASRMPSALIVVLTLFVFYKIGRLFLDKRSTNFLILLYAVSGAVGLFKSSIGVGLYIFFILLAFYKIEKFLFAPDDKLRGKTIDFQLSLIFVVISLMLVPDAYFFVPFFAILILVNIKKIGFKRLLASLITPVLLFAFFIYYEFILAKQLTGLPNATYEHYLGRQSGLEVVFNIKNLILGYSNNFSIFLVILFTISILILVVFRITKHAGLHRLLIHVTLLFSLHFIVWMFFTKMENGHLLNGYPVVFLFIAYAFKVINDFIRENKNIKDGLKKAFIATIYAFCAIILSFNFYHTFILFDNLSLDKSSYPAFYTPGYIPAGYHSGHKVGIKSAAYLLRKEAKLGENLVSDKGSAFNFIYMGGEMTPYSASNGIELMRAGEDIYKDYRIRFIAISPDFQNEEYLEYIDSQGFNKIVVMYKGKDIYYVYDVLETEDKITVIQRDEFDREYRQEYTNIDAALPYFFNF